MDVKLTRKELREIQDYVAMAKDTENLAKLVCGYGYSDPVGVPIRRIMYYLEMGAQFARKPNSLAWGKVEIKK